MPKKPNKERKKICCQKSLTYVLSAWVTQLLHRFWLIQKLNAVLIQIYNIIYNLSGFGFLNLEEPSSNFLIFYVINSVWDPFSYLGTQIRIRYMEVTWFASTIWFVVHMRTIDLTMHVRQFYKFPWPIRLGGSHPCEGQLLNKLQGVISKQSLPSLVW